MSDSVEERKINNYLLWSLGSFFLFYQYIVRVAPSVLIDDIMRKYNVDAAAFGQFSGIYYIGYSLAHIPLGIMLDRFRLKKQLFAYVVMVILGIYPLVFIKSWGVALLGRLVTGIGSSAAILALFKIVGTYFEDKKFSQMISYSVTIGLMGALYAGAPLKFIKNELGFDTALNLLIIFGFVIATLVLFLVKDKKSDHKEQINFRDVISDITKVLGNFHAMAISILLGLMIGVIEGFADIWGVAFMEKVKGFGQYEAASIVSVIYLAICICSPLVSIFAEKTEKYFLTLFICALTISLSLLYVIFIDFNSYILGAITMFVIGMGASYQVIGIYKSTTFVDARVKTLAASVANMIIMVFGYFFHSIIGKVISLLEESGFDKAESMKFGLIVIPICGLTAAAFFIIYYYFYDCKKKSVIVEQ